METPRERFFIANSMIVLLKAIEGKVTKVELRDEKELIGRIVSVDGYMNITLSNVTYTSHKGTKLFDSFFVNGKTLRYVHIPDEVDMQRAMESTLQRYNTREANLRVRQEIKDAALQKMKKKHEAAAREMLRQQAKSEKP